jgi:hypothetical protein
MFAILSQPSLGIGANTRTLSGETWVLTEILTEKGGATGCIFITTLLDLI